MSTLCTLVRHALAEWDACILREPIPHLKHLKTIEIPYTVGVISEFPMVRICILKSIVKWECMWHKFKAPSFDSSQVLFTHQASSQSYGLSCLTAGLFLIWERHEEVAFCVEQGGQPPDHTWRNKPERPRGLETLNRCVSPYIGIAAMCIWNHMSYESYVSCACHAAVMNDSMSMADTLYRQHCEALSCLGGTRHFRRCWASYFHSAKKMSASAGWGAPSLILLLLSKQEVQKQRQSTSFAFSFAEKEVLSFKVSKWKTCWLSFFNLLGDKQTI